MEEMGKMIEEERSEIGRVSTDMNSVICSLRSKRSRTNGESREALDYLASHADILLARHAIFPPQRTLGRKDCVTSQKNVCVGGYGLSRSPTVYWQRLYVRWVR